MAWTTAMTWLIFGDEKEVGLTSGQVCTLIGIDPVTMQNWSNRKLIRSFPVSGKGDPRIYGSYEVICITLARRLMQLGFGTRSAFVVAEGVWGAFLVEKEDSLKRAFIRGKSIEPELASTKALVSVNPSGDLQLQIARHDPQLKDDLVVVFRFGLSLIDMANRAMTIRRHEKYPSPPRDIFQLEKRLASTAKQRAERKKSPS